MIPDHTSHAYVRHEIDCFVLICVDFIVTEQDVFGRWLLVSESGCPVGENAIIFTYQQCVCVCVCVCFGGLGQMLRIQGRSGHRNWINFQSASFPIPSAWTGATVTGHGWDLIFVPEPSSPGGEVVVVVVGDGCLYWRWSCFIDLCFMSCLCVSVRSYGQLPTGGKHDLFWTHILYFGAMIEWSLRECE